MKRVITLGGLHGTGKSSVADRIAKKFGLRRVSAGMIFRKLAKERGYTLEEYNEVAEVDPEIDRLMDNTLRDEAQKGNVVLDGQLAAWMAGENADYRILLTAPLEVRVRRIAERDEISFEEAKQETMAREASEKERYFSFYGIDTADLSVYDLIINTDKYDLDGVVKVVTVAIDTFLSMVGS